MKQSLAVFRSIQRELGRQLLAEHRLVCKVGTYRGSVVLKLQKSSWTNDAMNVVQNTSGIFFSVWVDEQSLRDGCAHYNIHALKLRQLKGYDIQKSTVFASEFRKRFATIARRWPNASVDYGPLTLMQGWISIRSEGFRDDVRQLLSRFVDVSEVIDQMLNAHRKS